MNRPNRWVWEPLYMLPLLWIGFAVVLSAIGYLLLQAVWTSEVIPVVLATVVTVAFIAIVRRLRIRSARLR